MSEQISKFECTFDNANMFKDGNLRFRFEAPFAEISQAIQTVRGIDEQMMVNIELIEKDTEVDVFPAQFYRLNVYKDGNSKFEFLTEAKEFDIPYAKLSKFVKQNAILTVEV